MKNNIPNLVEYLREYAVAGACGCKHCRGKPDPEPLPEKTSDVVFFRVGAKPGADAQELRQAIAAHSGEFCECNPFDGKEHGFMELGGWIGSQEGALILMGFGEVLGLWKVLTPRTVISKDMPDVMVHLMASSGFITIKAEKTE